MFFSSEAIKAFKSFKYASLLALISFLFTLFASTPAWSATLSGTVTDAADNVTAVHPVAIDLMDTVTGDSLIGITNNPDGSYEFLDVPPGDYLLFFNAVDAANGYIDELYDEYAPCSDGGCDRVNSGTFYTVTDGANTLDEDLAAGAVITGTITAAGTGTAIQSVNIEFYDGGGNYVHGTQSQPDGTYSSGGLPPQPLYVVASGVSQGYQTEIFDDVFCPGEDCFSVAGNATQLNPGAGASAVADFDLAPVDNSLAMIAGTLTGSDTLLPLEGILVSVFDLDCNFVDAATSDANGDYSVPVGSPGDFYVFAVANDTLFNNSQSLYMNRQYPGVNIFDSCYPELNDLSLGDVVTVGQDEEITGIDMVLEPGGEILGTVSDSNGVLDSGVAGIRLFRPDGFQVMLTTNLEPDNSYRMGGILPGTYQLVLTAGGLGLVDERYDDIPCPRNSCAPGQGNEFIFAGTESFTGIDAVLGSGSVVRGTITDASSTLPVDGQCVFIYTSAGVYATIGCADANGDFETTGGLPAGDYRLSNQLFTSVYFDVNGNYAPQVWTNDGSFIACGDECDFLLGDTFTVDGTTALEDIDLAMVLNEASITIAGTLTGSDTLLPLEGILVSVFDLDCNFIDAATSDANGDYSVPVGSPGDFYVFAVANDTLFNNSQSLYMNRQYPGVNIFDSCYPELNDLSLGDVVTVGQDEEITGIDMVLEPGGEILGTVSDSNGVLDSGVAGIRLFRPDGFQVMLTTNLEPDNSYRMGGILPGTYQLALTAGGLGLIDERYDDIPCPRNSCAPGQGNEFVFAGTESFTGIDAVLDSGSVVRGTITDASSAMPVDGQCVFIYTSAGVYATIGCADANGDFETTGGLPAGDYRLSNQLFTSVYFDVNGNYAPQVWTNDGSFIACGDECDFLLGDTFTVDGTNPVENIDLAMVLNQTSLTGTIVDSSDGNIPVHPVVIDLFGTDGSYLEISTTNNPDGSYELSGVMPGQYLVLFNAVDAAGTYADELYQDIPCSNGSCPIGAVGTPVDLVLGSNTLDEQLNPGASISGVISSSATGQPLGPLEGRARLYETDGTQVTTTLTGDGGTYNFGGVAPGDYYVVLAPRFGNLIDELYDDIYCPRLSCDTTGGTVISVNVGDVVENINAILDPGSQIRGYVRTGDQPLVNAIILVYDDEGDYAGFGRMLEDGYVTGSSFPAGDYYVTFEDAGYVNTAWSNRPCGDPCDPTVGELVTVNGVDDAFGIDFQAFDESIGSTVISGIVTEQDGGAPIFDVKVCAVAQGDDSIENCSVTSPAGSYLIGGLPPRDDYSVFTRDVGGQAYYGALYNNQECCDVGSGTPVDITGGNAKIDFSLESSGLIGGKITDSVTGEGIPYVEILVLDENANQVNALFSETSDEEAFRGMYRVSGLPDGVYYLFANGQWQGYANEVYPDVKRLAQFTQDPITNGQPIVIQNGSFADNIDLQLDPAGSISGTVSDANGILPFNKARIRLYNSGDRDTLVQYGNWNEDATYTIPGLPPGTYDVLLTTNGTNLVGERYDDVTCPRNSCESGLGTPVVIGPAEDVTGIDATLDTGSLVVGTLTDAQAAQGVGGFCLGIYTAEGIYAGFACTDQDGNYGSTTGLPAGDYRASNQIFSNEINGGYLPQVWTEDGSFVNCGVPCDFTAGDTFTLDGVNDSQGINIAMEQGSSISGNVQFGGAPVEGSDVVLLNEFAVDIKSVKTDASGNYAFEGLGSGSYYVRTLNNNGYQDRLFDLPDNVVCSPDCNPFSGSLINLPASSSETGINFTLTVAGSISGTVTDDSATPLSGVTVEAYNALGNRVSTSLTDLNGDYVLGGLGNGQFYVRTQNQLGYRNSLYDGLGCQGACDVLSGTPIAVSSGVDVPGIDFVLSRGSSLSGTVLGQSDSQPTPMVGTVINIYSSSGQFVGDVSTDGAGFYTFPGLEAGDYHVVTRTLSDFHLDESADGSVCQANCVVLDTPTTSVGVNEDRTLDFELAYGTANYFQVLNDNDAKLSGVTLIAYDLSGREIKRAVSALNAPGKPAGVAGQASPGTTNAALFGLPPGEVYIATENSQGYINQVYSNLECIPACDILEGTRIVSGSVAPGGNGYLITLNGGLSIKGRVLEAGPDLIPSRLSVTVQAINLDSPVSGTGRVIPNTDGSFEISGLSPGSYELRTVTTRSAELDYVDKVLGGSTCTPEPCVLGSGEGTAIELVDSDVEGIDIDLSPGGVIVGNAFDANGNAVLSGSASLFSASNKFLGASRFDDTGRFELSGLAPGTYFVIITPRSIGLSRTLYEGISCPGLCDSTTGTPVVVDAGGAASLLSFSSSQVKGVSTQPGTQIITIEPVAGYAVRGSLKTFDDQPVKSTGVYFFNQDGSYAGEALTDGAGEFVTPTGLPNGTYFAATSRAAIPEDTPESAADAEDGAVEGLADQVWSGFTCDGICAPSQGSAIGTPIVINGADEGGIDIVLPRAPGISVEKSTNGIDADTPNGGDAPEIAAGAAVNWTYEVTNTGGDELVNIVVTDDQGVSVSCPESSLASDASMICTASGVAADLSQDPFTGVMGNCAGVPESRLYQNTGSVTAETNGGVMVDDMDSSHYCNPIPFDDNLFKDGFESL